MKQSFEQENFRKYKLSGNTSLLEFKNGKTVSSGSLNGVLITIDLRYCKGCGICSEECPTESLMLVPEEGMLKDNIYSSFPKPSFGAGDFNPKELLAWQELPDHGGLIIANNTDSYNLTGYWRVGEVVIANADKCVLCGLCYQQCPEDVITIEQRAN